MSLDTNNLRIFPASNRSEPNQMNNNWLTEFNMTSFVNQIVAPGKTGFVISQSDSITNYNNKSFKFNIAGYYFELAGSDPTTPNPITDIINAASDLNPESVKGIGYIAFTQNNGKITAYINVKEDSNNSGYKYLVGNDTEEETIYLKGDNESNIKNITNDNAVDTTAKVEIYSLDLFTYTDKDITIPSSSRITINDLQLIGGVGFKFIGDGTNVTKNTTIEVKNGEITAFNLDDGEL